MPRALLPVVCLLLGVLAGALGVHLARGPAAPSGTEASQRLAAPSWIQGQRWSQAWGRATARGVPVLAIVADDPSAIGDLDEMGVMDPSEWRPPSRLPLWKSFVGCRAVELLAWVEPVVVEKRDLGALAAGLERVADAVAVVVHTDGRDEAVRLVWWPLINDGVIVRRTDGRRRIDGSTSQTREFARDFPQILEESLVEAIARDAAEIDVLARANRASADPVRFAAWVRSARQRIGLDPSVAFDFAPALAAALEEEPAALSVLFDSVAAEAGRRWHVARYEDQLVLPRVTRRPAAPPHQGPPSPNWCGTGRGVGD